MNKVACWTGSAWTAVCVLVVAAPAPGQNFDAASMLYGHGVHAYFDGDASEAEEYFTRAIQSNSNDPRAYYFRALSRLRLGHDEDARSDFEAGAAAEARQPSRYAVGMALQRVQGRERLLLEQYRRRAREQHAMMREDQVRARYEQLTGRESDVLRQKVTVPLDQLLPPGEVQPMLGRQPSAEPRRTLPTSAAASAGASDAPAPTTDVGDPFADDPGPSQPAASQPERSPVDDLFGTPAPAEDDPFATPAEASTPTPDDGAATEEGPFGLDEENSFSF